MSLRNLTVAMLLAVAVLFAGCGEKEQQTGEKKIPTIIVGHVGHDHQIALYIAADNSAEYVKTSGYELKPIKDMKLYDLMKNGEKIANIEVVVVGGGSKMPTAMRQGQIGIGFGGVAPVVAAIDKGADIKLISPLHSKGDMFVLGPDHEVNNWAEFVVYAKQKDEPIRIGYKNPQAVAKLIFEDALKHEGLTFSGDVADANVDVHMVNCKGGSKLNTMLESGHIEGYVGNNPFPAIGLDKKILKVVSDLEDLPPGNFLNHPCCCIAATRDVLKESPEAVEGLLVLFLQATDTINKDLDLSVKSAVKWLGVNENVARTSIPTSGYSMNPSPEWHKNMEVWFNAMKGLGQFTGSMKDMDSKDIATEAYDFSELSKALETLGK